MSAWHTLLIPLLLCAVSVTGIVALLAFDGAADVASFVLAASPLIVGALALLRHVRS